MCFSVKRTYSNNCYIGQVDGDPAHDTGTTEYTQKNCKRTLSCTEFYMLVNQSNSGTSTSLEISQTIVQFKIFTNCYWPLPSTKSRWLSGKLNPLRGFHNLMVLRIFDNWWRKYIFLLDYQRTHWIWLSCRVCPLSEFPSASGSQHMCLRQRQASPNIIPPMNLMFKLHYEHCEEIFSKSKS